MAPLRPSPAPYLLASQSIVIVLAGIVGSMLGLQHTFSIPLKEPCQPNDPLIHWPIF